MPIPNADLDDKGSGCVESFLVAILLSPFMIILNLLFGNEVSQDLMSDEIEARRDD